MSCIITYKGNKYTQEQFKEYISSNKNEFSHIIAKNKDVIDSFKRKMEGIDFVFSQSPELASIGSKSQYLQYLSTIFKTSKVKNIVYRGIGENNVKLFQYFTNNKSEAYMYAKANITKGGKITERNPIPVIKNNVAEKYNLSKNILWAITDTQLGVNGLEFEGLISKDEADEARRLINTNKDIQNLQKLIELYPSVSVESESDLMKQFDDDEFIKNKPKYDKIRKELDSFFSREQVGKITIALLNIKNPYIDEIVQEDLENDRDAYKNGHDGAFLMDGDHFLVKSNTEQIHILGSKEDIQGFKEFAQGKQFQKLTAEEKAKTIEQVTKEHRSIVALKDLSAKLAWRIGGKVKFENKTDADWKGYNQGMTSVLNEAYMTPDTPFHEIAFHPIIRALKSMSSQKESITLQQMIDNQEIEKNCN